MKFHESTVLTNIDRFPGVENNGRIILPRDNNDMLQIWKLCEYFQPCSILEIGFSAGQTFGIFLESTASNVRYVAVDNDFQRNHDVWNDIFKNCAKALLIEKLQVDSRYLNVNGKFDLVHVDGDHTYEFVKNDVKVALSIMHNQSILIMDDTLCADVEQVIKEDLLGQYGFVPFLAGNKQICFRHTSHNIDEFVHVFLREKLEDFVMFTHWEYNGFYVLKMHVPTFIEENQDVFVRALKQYDV